MNDSIHLTFLSLFLLLSTTKISLVKCGECKLSYRVPGTYVTANVIICTSVTLDSQQSIKSLIINDEEINTIIIDQVIVTESNIPVVVNSIFQTLTPVEILKLNGDNITDIQPNAFIGMMSEEIQLTNNKLTKIKEHTFAGLDNMRKLDMSFNNISILENINEMSSLYLLNVTNNNLVKINEHCFKGMSKLFKLNLSYNDLTKLENLDGLDNLEELYISNNNLLIITENSFKDVPKLKVLNLFKNKLTTLDHVNQLHFLVRLNVGFNLIKTLTENDIQSLGSLQSLDLSNNKITNLSPKLFTNLHNLTHLYLRNNTIESFPNNIFYKTIEDIDLSINMLYKTTECDQFQGFVNLAANYINDICHFGPNTTSINIGDNEILEIKKGSLAHLTKLTFLNLTTNFIKTIDVDAFENLHNLTTLLLRDNFISIIPMGTFYHLKSLENLDLSHNKIEIFSLGIFTGVNKLKILHLDHNTITFLDSAIFAHMDQLQELYLHGNPLIELNDFSLPGSLKILSVHFEKIGCEELQSMLSSVGESYVKKGTELKGSNIHGIACELEGEEMSSRKEEDFLKIKSIAFAIHTCLVLIIVLFVILFISHTISWYHNHFMNKEHYLKKNGRTCSLTLLTEDDQA